MDDDSDARRPKEPGNPFAVAAHQRGTRPSHGVLGNRSHGVLVNATRRPKDSASSNKPENLSDEDEADEDLYREVRKFNPNRPERRSRRNHPETSEEHKGLRREPKYGQLELSERREDRRDAVEQRKSSPRRGPSKRRDESPPLPVEGHHFGRLWHTYSDVDLDNLASRHRALQEKAAARRKEREEAEADGWAVPEKREGDWI